MFVEIKLERNLFVYETAYAGQMLCQGSASVTKNVAGKRDSIRHSSSFAE